MIQKEFVSHWNQYIENMAQTPKEFYALVESLVKSNDVSDIKISRVTHKEKGIFSSSREYLQIKSKGYFFEVCAAAYGKGFFISYWQLENRTGKKSLLARIPIIGSLLSSVAIPETFFTIDTRMMFQGMIHSCIMSAIDSETSKKGLRALSETERMPKNMLNESR